jgi:phosphoglycolate phosphatase
VVPFPFAVVVFDLDGTLLNTAPDLAEAVNHMLGHFDRPKLEPDRIAKMIGRGMRVLMERALLATGSMTPALTEAALPIFFQYYEAHLADQTHPYDGVIDALELLRSSGARLAICTNKPERLTRALARVFRWEKYFAAIVGGDTVGSRKPDPAPLLAAIERAGGGRSILIGDSINDTETAKAAGLPCVAVTFGYRDGPAEMLGATRLVDHYEQLVPVLLEIASSANALEIL